MQAYTNEKRRIKKVTNLCQTCLHQSVPWRQSEEHAALISCSKHTVCSAQVSITFQIFLNTFWVISTAPRSAAHLVRSGDPHINVDSSISATNTRDLEEPAKWRWWMSVRLINNYSFQFSPPSRDFTVEVYVFLTKKRFSVTQERNPKRKSGTWNV